MAIHLQLTLMNQDITQLTFNPPKYSQLLMFCFYFFDVWWNTSISNLLLIIFKQTKKLLLQKLDYLVSHKQTPPLSPIPLVTINQNFTQLNYHYRHVLIQKIKLPLQVSSLQLLIQISLFDKDYNSLWPFYFGLIPFDPFFPFLVRTS